MRARRGKDAMNQNQTPDDPRVGSQNPVNDEESVSRDQNAALREDNEDLRASALWWRGSRSHYNTSALTEKPPVFSNRKSSRRALFQFRDRMSRAFASKEA